MARLAGLGRDDIQSDRFSIAATKASEWGCIVVLKGAFTVIANPDGRVTAIPFATDALATAGTGDVLSGCIVGLMAQGMAPFEAAVAGAYLHGLAGVLAGQAMTNRSVMAGDVMRALPEALQIINATS
jgi:NAD(P)H-hydrate epimerase